MSRLEPDELPAVPPALLLIWQDFAAGHEWHQIRMRMRVGLKDLKDQSLAFESQNVATQDSGRSGHDSCVLPICNDLCL